MNPTRRLLATLLAGSLVVAACGDDDESPQAADDDVTITLVTHDSFNISEAVLDEFTATTGIAVDLLPSGDAGAVVNQAILTKGKPQGDVLFGIDNTFLSRALDEDLFIAYESPALAGVDDALELDDEHRVTPIDTGDVCLNYDKAALADADLQPPTSLQDLIDPAYAGTLVVENPATSSPGLAFLLATIDEFGEDGWQDYWTSLVANDVEVAAGWEEAYYGSFSGSAGSEGDRPLVVSYASSPPAEVIFAEEPLDDAPTGVVVESCARQIEFAGILSGTEHEAEAQQLIDFLLSETFQADIPLNMFVYPVIDVTLPDEFVQYGAEAEDPHLVDPDVVAEHRDDWIEEWTEIVLR
ncbi:thiamine ABC transporter substrate-binding protein [Actinospongicola halichondriae]|uniref:thiamine ABC transporter substrate-binding protein n=1 Tax=Actinospongicola halichondriae TaxID=3236844 RepID=UPI003D4BB90D